VKKYEDVVNLQGVEAYCGGRLPTACYIHSVYIYRRLIFSALVSDPQHICQKTCMYSTHWADTVQLHCVSMQALLHTIYSSNALNKERTVSILKSYH